MRKLLLLLMIPALFILLIYGCAAELEDNMPQGPGYGDGAAGQGDMVLPGAGASGVPGTGGAGVQYERGREDYPGQNYASLVGAGNNTAHERAAGNTGNQLSAGSGIRSGGSGLALMSISSPVRQGETCTLSAQGRPDTQYTITGVYRNSGNMVTSTAVRQSGNNGIVEFEWNVGRQTEPGTYGIMISGGGEQITASYTVIEQE
jgi:hypothetical protein